MRPRQQSLYTNTQAHTWVGPVGLLGGSSAESNTTITGCGCESSMDRGSGLSLASCQCCKREEHGDRRVSVNSSSRLAAALWALLGYFTGQDDSQLCPQLLYQASCVIITCIAGKKGQKQRQKTCCAMELHCLPDREATDALRVCCFFPFLTFFFLFIFINITRRGKWKKNVEKVKNRN